MAMPYTLEEMADRMAIYDLYARYVHANDDGDMDALDKIYMPDTTFDWTETGFIKTDWASMKAKSGLKEVFAYMYHLCGNIRIDFNEDRSIAYVKSKTINPSGRRDENGDAHLFQVQGGYSDTLINTEDGWRIKDRYWNHAWISGGMNFVKSMPAMMEKPEKWDV